MLLLTGAASSFAQTVREAEQALELGDYAAARSMLEALVRRPGGEPEMYVMLAVSRMNLQDSAGAIEACEQGLRRFPSSQRIAGYYGGVLAKAVPRAEGAARLERALAQAPGSPALQKALGEALFDLRQSDPRAGQLLASARKRLPQDAEAQFLYGRWACLNQQDAACVAALDRALALTAPDNDRARLQICGLKAAAEVNLKREKDARASFELAAAANRKLGMPLPDVTYRYVRFLTDEGEDESARLLIQELLERCPRFGPAHLEWARLLAEGSPADREASVKEAEAALREAGNNLAEQRAARVFLAKTCFTLGRKEEAEAHKHWLETH